MNFNRRSLFKLFGVSVVSQVLPRVVVTEPTGFQFERTVYDPNADVNFPAYKYGSLDLRTPGRNFIFDDAAPSALFAGEALKIEDLDVVMEGVTFTSTKIQLKSVKAAKQSLAYFECI